MTNQLSQIKWGRVILTALAVYIISFIVVFLIVTGYASYLGFQARGAPDQAMIQAFASQYGPWISNIAIVLFTILGGMHVARRVENAIPLHGLIVGALAGLLNLALDVLSLSTIIITILTIGAGWLGSKLGTKK